VQAYPELTLAELNEALQEATEAAERHEIGAASVGANR
jgi:uncharacterized protein (DUF433 family)